MNRQYEYEHNRQKENPLQLKPRPGDQASPYRHAGPSSLMRHYSQMGNQAAQRLHNPNGIPEPVKTQMEHAFQADFSNVTISSNSSKAADLGALAYTQGSEIHFAPGMYNPQSATGREILRHEVAHVKQQREGRVSPTRKINGVPVNDNPTLEKEADFVGRSADKTGLIVKENTPPTPHTPAASLSPGNSGNSGNVKQCKLLRWQHPVTGNVTDGFTTAEKKAEKLDDATEQGKTILQKAVDKLNAKTITDGATFKKEFSHIDGDTNKFVGNFTNKLNDYLDPNKKSPPPNKEAGYIIEEYVTKESQKDTGISTQYVIGGSRPDFRVVTGAKHTFKSKIYDANAFVDITSQAEAQKGHILDKITRASTVDDVINHPHLWDSFYSPINWGTGTKVVPMINDAQMQERAKRKADEAEAGRNRELRPKKQKTSP